MGDHIPCQAKTTQWTNGRIDARQGHRVNTEKDIYLDIRNATLSVSFLQMLSYIIGDFFPPSLVGLL